MSTLTTMVRYALVGVVNTAATILVMASLAHLGIHYALYTAVGYLVGFVVSYLLNGIFTFRGAQLSHRAFRIFVIINGSLLVIVEALQFCLIELLGVRELPAVAAGMVLYTVTGFFLNRRFVFRGRTTTSH